MSFAIVRVALPVPLPQCFDYTAENVCADDLGRCVRVPFGRGEKTGLIVGLPDAELGSRLHAIIEIREGADPRGIIDGMGPVLAELLSRNKHPESYEIATVSLRDDSGKARRTLLRDERLAWLKDGRDFRLSPRR